MGFAELTTGIAETLREVSSKLTTQNEAIAKQSTSLDDFAAKISEQANKQIIKSLEDVITSFNTNLVNQFGDNFKALNVAVHELVTWRDNYRDNLNDMQDSMQAWAPVPEPGRLAHW